MKAALFIGRFQPPHIGHYAVLDEIRQFMKHNPELGIEKIVVSIVQGKNTSEDKDRNPLTGDERQEIMENSGRANDVKFMISGSAYNAMELAKAAGYEVVAIAGGPDRVFKYVELLDKYFPENEHRVIVLDRNLLGTRTQAASGTAVRTAVRAGRFEEFMELTGLKAMTAELAFEKIREALK